MRAVADRDNRTRTDTIVKNDARYHLVNASRSLIAVCEAWPQMTDAKRSELNLPIRDREPTPQTRLTVAPFIDILSQNGLSVKVGLRDAAASTRRRRPAGAIGATILTHVGETAPATIEGWTFQGNTSKTTVDITFPPMTPRGAKVWIVATWFSRTSMSSPPSRPLFTYLSGADGLAQAA